MINIFNNWKIKKKCCKIQIYFQGDYIASFAVLNAISVRFIDKVVFEFKNLK